MDSDLKKKLLKDIDISGFQTELEVASILKENGWTVETNTNYVDYDSGKSREIDLVAYKNPKKNDVYIELNLVVEVKKTSKPWIIFTSESRRHKILRGLGLLKKIINRNPQFRKDKLDDKCPHLHFKRHGTSFKEAFKKPNEPSKIYEAIISACKAAVYKINSEAPSKENELNPYDSRYSTEVYIYYPIVVLEGSLIEAFLDENGKIEIQESDFLPVYLRHKSTNIEEDEFYCDIVTKKYLKNYIEEIDNWISDIQSWKENTT